MLLADDETQAGMVKGVEAGEDQEVNVRSTDRCMNKHHLTVARGKQSKRLTKSLLGSSSLATGIKAWSAITPKAVCDLSHDDGPRYRGRLWWPYGRERRGCACASMCWAEMF